MDALVRTIQDLFASQHRYVVPAYQRPYVWDEEKQWGPLWEDVERIADSRIAEVEDHHFLGAIVIRREKSPPGGITEWSVIDGQQRLTTLQILISALAAAARDDGFDRQAGIIEGLIHQDALHAEGDDRFKFWPTSTNREAFRDVMQEGGPGGELIDDPTNTIHEAWVYFKHQAHKYAHEDTGESDQLATRYAALREAITGLLQIVTISLDKEDPAQVIFETLNARGTPLLAMDLVKNALFDAAQKQGVTIETVHAKYWDTELGDVDYWGTEQRLGRITVPRSEAFLMHWLISELGESVNADSIFETFRRKILSGAKADDAVGLIRELNEDAATMRGFDSFPPGTAEHRFFNKLSVLDTTTLQPVALLLFKAGLSDDRLARALTAIEAYLVRRMLMGLTTKEYNKLAARLIAIARTNLAKADDLIIEELVSSTSNTSRWPSDQELSDFLLNKPLYGWINQRRIVMALSAIELTRRAGKTEAIAELPPKLQVEHVMPQAWHANWPLDEDTEESLAARDAMINVIGNLTLVAGSLNASMSHSEWSKKRSALQDHSMLMLNKELASSETWSETEIRARGELLVNEILAIWPGPQEFMSEDWVMPEAEYHPENAGLKEHQLTTVIAEGSDLLNALLKNLASKPGERRPFSEVERDLGWSAGRLPGVLGGYGMKFNAAMDDRRPWHIDVDREGVWWMWVDDETADVVKLFEIEEARNA